jgi:acyl carrier protein
MNRSEITSKVKEILVATLKHSKFEMSDDLSAADVHGWDSLSHMIIIAEVEKKFNIRFKLKELNEMKNIGSLIGLIESKTAS